MLTNISLKDIQYLFDSDTNSDEANIILIYMDNSISSWANIEKTRGLKLMEFLKYVQLDMIENPNTDYMVYQIVGPNINFKLSKRDVAILEQNHLAKYMVNHFKTINYKLQKENKLIH